MVAAGCSIGGARSSKSTSTHRLAEAPGPERVPSSTALSFLGRSLFVASAGGSERLSFDAQMSWLAQHFGHGDGLGHGRRSES